MFGFEVSSRDIFSVYIYTQVVTINLISHQCLTYITLRTDIQFMFCY